MSFEIMRSPDFDIGLIVGSGHVTGRELVSACSQLVEDPRWTPGDTEVWDLSAAAEVDVSPDELDLLVESAHGYSERIGGSRCVFITSRDGVDALLRLFKLLTRDLDRDYHIARTRREAAEWLNVDPDAFEAMAASDESSAGEVG